MMDVIMVGVLLISMVSLKLFADWCDKQVNPDNK